MSAIPGSVSGFTPATCDELKPGCGPVCCCPAAPAKIACRHLTKVYENIGRVKKSFVALSDINLEVREAEFLSIVGPSGCGKSTLLNIIGGHIPPSAGAVTVGGGPVTGPSKRVGMVFQNFGLFPWRTVAGNVEFGPQVTGLGPKESREIALRYIHLVGLDGFLQAYPKQLSGGMKQRVALARALANDPEILLMDEPLGSLDAQTRETLQEEVARIWADTGKTIVFVTHNIDEAVILGDRVVVMAGPPGRIIDLIEVDLPGPRAPAARRFSPRLLVYKSHIWELIRQAGKVDQP
ncbi:MAG TPA: ABC transporter ATP-binding protein [Bacillota bacterium]|jgi:NitT/TauT family transport system ATP-binding protein